MQIINRNDAQHLDFKDVQAASMDRSELENIIKNTEWIYYHKSKEHQQEFFLPGEAQFFPLKKIDEKYDEYRKLAADEEKSEAVGFRVDYGILGLLKKSKGAIRQLKTLDPKKLEKTLYEIGVVSIELALDAGRFEQYNLRKFLSYYEDVLNSKDEFDKLSGAASKDPADGQKGKYTEAVEAHKQIWQGILGDYEKDQPKAVIPDEPDDVIPYLPDINSVKPAADINFIIVGSKNPSPTNPENYKKPITNYSDLGKELNWNKLGDSDGLEKEVQDAIHEKPSEQKTDAPVIEVRPLIRPKEFVECKREQVPGGDIYLCKMPERHKCCDYRGLPFANPKWPPRCNLENYESLAKKSE